MAKDASRNCSILGEQGEQGAHDDACICLCVDCEAFEKAMLVSSEVEREANRPIAPARTVRGLVGMIWSHGAEFLRRQ